MRFCRSVGRVGVDCRELPRLHSMPRETPFPVQCVCLVQMHMTVGVVRFWTRLLSVQTRSPTDVTKAESAHPQTDPLCNVCLFMGMAVFLYPHMPRAHRG